MKIFTITQNIKSPIDKYDYPVGWWIVTSQSVDLIAFKDKKVAERLCQVLNDSPLDNCDDYEYLSDKENILISIGFERIRLETGMTWEEFLPYDDNMIPKVKNWLLRANELRE